MERKAPLRKLRTLLIGDSRAMRRIRRQILQVAPSHAPVLIRGERGVGKHLIARLIHDMSNRDNKTFITLRCEGMPADLLERALFGHAAGAFPGARHARSGLLEKACGGSIFLDEIGALGLSAQFRLLRLLQDREFEPLGGTTAIPADVRLVATTRLPLEQMVRRAAFREDLYYRLTVFPIQVPPLRKHKSDMPALVEHFIARYGRAHGKAVAVVSTGAVGLLKRQRWPGNVRELETCVEEAMRHGDGGLCGAVGRPDHESGAIR